MSDRPLFIRTLLESPRPLSKSLLLLRGWLCCAMLIRVKVIPRSSRTALAGELADGTLRVKVAAVPEKGKANEALCEFLAAHFGVPKSQVEVVSGAASTLKTIRIAGR